MKIKIGKFIKSPTGYIGKIVKINKDKSCDVAWNDGSIQYNISKEYIKEMRKDYAKL